MKSKYGDMTVAELSHEQAVIQDYLFRAILEARRGGTTWAAIGSSLGVSTSEAHRRYHWLEKVPQGVSGPSSD